MASDEGSNEGLNHHAAGDGEEVHLRSGFGDTEDGGIGTRDGHIVRDGARRRARENGGTVGERAAGGEVGIGDADGERLARSGAGDGNALFGDQLIAGRSGVGIDELPIQSAGIEIDGLAGGDDGPGGIEAIADLLLVDVIGLEAAGGYLAGEFLGGVDDLVA